MDDDGDASPSWVVIAPSLEGSPLICLTPTLVARAGWGPVRFFRPFRPLLLGWLISFVAWGTVAILLGVEVVGRGGDIWSIAVRSGLRDWAPWAILTPLLFRFVARFPIERRGWFIAWPAHILVFVLATLAIQGWKNAVGWGAVNILGQSSPPMEVLVFRSGNPPPLPPGGLPMRMPPPGEGMRGIPMFDLFHFVSFELPTYLLIVTSAHLLLYRRRLDERAASLARARLDALRTQLQPHFLFNTVNTIAGLVYDHPAKADAMLIAVSDLLRISLETSSEVELPLRREIECVERYLAIMVARFEDRIAFIIDIDAAAEVALVPAFILQPLVENAVQHGLQPRAEGGIVTVRARRQDTKLRVVVSDDGVGFRNTPDASEGIGLGNARARLKELYGRDASLEMYDGRQTEVILELPYRVAP